MAAKYFEDMFANYTKMCSFDTDAVGTVRLSRSRISSDMKPKIPLGIIGVLYSDNLMALKWDEKREMTMLSTFDVSDTQIVKSRQGDKNKLVVIIDYKHNMGAVHMSDQMLQSYQVECKRKKVWYKKQFQHVLN